jgi:hypothetical protein
MSSVTNFSILLVKVGAQPHGNKSPRCLKVRYEDYADQQPLPADLLDGKASWQSSLRRNRSCDQVVTKGLIVAQNDSKKPKDDAFILVQSDAPPLNTKLPWFHSQARRCNADQLANFVLNASMR